MTTLKKKISDFDLNDVLDLLVIFSYDYLITYKDNQFSFISYNSSHNELLSFKNSDPELIISFQSLVKRHILIPLKELNPKNIEILKSYHTLSNIPFHFAKWKLNIDNDPVSVNMDIKEWVSKRSYNEDELNFFWLEPYHSELSQYLQDQAKENLGLNLTELEILSISEYLSEIYPLSKAFNLIYFSVSSALRFQVQKKPNEKILRNYLVKKILNMAEEKKGNLHIIKDFNRPANISTSLKGQIIRKNIFKLDSDHFTLAKTSVIDSVDRKHPFI